MSRKLRNHSPHWCLVAFVAFAILCLGNRPVISQTDDSRFAEAPSQNSFQGNVPTAPSPGSLNPLRIAELPVVEPQLPAQSTPLEASPIDALTQPPTNADATEPTGITPQPTAAPPTANPAAPATPSAATQKKEEQPEPTVFNRENVHAALDRVMANEEMSPEDQKDVADQLRRAVQSFEMAEKNRQRAAAFNAEATSAPAAIRDAQQQIATPLAEPQFTVAAKTPLAQLEQYLADLEKELDESQAELEEATSRADAKQQSDRRAEISSLIEALEKKIAESKEQPIPAVPSGRSLQKTFASRAEQHARTLAQQTGKAALEAELRRNKAMGELYTIQRDYAQRRVGWLKKAVAGWRKVINEQRKLESERQAAEARRKVREALPSLKEFAQRNAILAKQRTDLVESLETTSVQLDSTTKKLDALKADFESVRDKIDVGGMTVSAGLLLRNRRQRLPKPKLQQHRMENCVHEMQEISLALLDLEAERAQFGDLETQYSRLMSEVEASGSPDPTVDVASMVRELLENRRQYLDELLNDNKILHDRYSDLELASRNLLEVRNEYISYIDEHVLWIRSSDPLAVGDIRKAADAVLATTDIRGWIQGGADLLGDLRQRPMLSGLFAFGIVAMLLLRNRMSRRLRLLGESARLKHSVIPTLEAAGLTAAISLIWPLVVWFIGWRLKSSQSLEAWVVIGSALQTTAVIYGTLSLVRQICRTGGLGDKHFGWSASITKVLRYRLSWLMLIGCPIVFLFTVVQTYNDGIWSDSLGRFFFLVGLAILTFTMHSLLRKRGALAALLQQRQAEGLIRVRPMFYVVGTGVPVLLAVLSILGYSYTAQEVVLRFGRTLWLATAILVAWAILAKASYIVWRRVSYFRKIQRQQDAIQADQEVCEAQLAQESAADGRLGHQLQVCLRSMAALGLLAGVAVIWSSMFPALTILNRVELWSTSATVQQTIVGVDNQSTVEEVTQLVPVTLGHVLLCIAVITGTFIVSRNAPGLLEITVLAKLPLDHGGRHAVALIARYAFTMVGMIFAFQLIGITWSSVQWLVAAMTVGLGFGLQEIFANLVSGIIILMERPVRIGDHVTVSGTTGVITRMQMRATTITDYDNRELIVPNKKFITEEVINWTLSNPVTRMVINVGIGYSSDSSKAHELLMQVANEHPLVLANPEPSAVFTGFGNSTKDQQLRVYIASRKDYPVVQHSLHLAIEKAFKAADIEIAFPQQDLHIRSVDKLPAVIADAVNNKAA